MTRTISVRLNEEAMRALARLESTGRSRSEAVRVALLDTAGRGEALREQAERVAADPSYRHEVAEIHDLMDELSESW